jgi:dTMP kinase
MSRGRLIVLEGVDGAGTSTQAALLTEALSSLEYPCLATREPSDGPVGVLIRQVLTHRLVVPSGNRPPRMETMALLFAADRVDHLECEILPNLKDGITVVCDRYLHSSIAYQTLTSSDDEATALEWVATINSKAMIPDLVMVLDVPPGEAARRRSHRGGAEQVYEDDELQARLATFYTELQARFPAHPIARVDGSRSIEAVHAECLALALNLLKGDQSC